MKAELQQAADEVIAAVTIPPIEDCFDANPIVPRNAWLSAKALACFFKAEHPADEDCNVDVNWLMDEYGFEYSSDGTALVKKISGGWEVVCGVRDRRGEVEVTSLALSFTYPAAPNLSRVSACYSIEDEPSYGFVRRFLAMFGETGKGGAK